jgi:hypothetical protein
MKFPENPSIGSRVVPCGRTDGRTDMTKLIVAFRNFANAPKNQNTHFIFNNFFPGSCTLQATAQKICKNTDTHSEYVTLVAFPRQQWLRERASVLHL